MFILQVPNVVKGRASGIIINWAEYNALLQIARAEGVPRSAYEEVFGGITSEGSRVSSNSLSRYMPDTFSSSRENPTIRVTLDDRFLAPSFIKQVQKLGLKFVHSVDGKKLELWHPEKGPCHFIEVEKGKEKSTIIFIPKNKSNPNEYSQVVINY